MSKNDYILIAAAHIRASMVEARDSYRGRVTVLHETSKCHEAFETARALADAAEKEGLAFDLPYPPSQKVGRDEVHSSD